VVLLDQSRSYKTGTAGDEQSHIVAFRDGKFFEDHFNLLWLVLVHGNPHGRKHGLPGPGNYNFERNSPIMRGMRLSFREAGTNVRAFSIARSICDAS
jgi:hypothetical protein